MRYRVTHTTTYSGDEPVSVCHNEARLRPRRLRYQICRSHELHISPAPSIQTLRSDYFGNDVSVFSFNQGYDSLQVTAVSDVHLTPHGRAADDPCPPWEEVLDGLASRPTESDFSACEFAYESPRVRTSPKLAEYARSSFPAGRPILAAVADLTSRIHREFQYDSQATHVHSTVDEVFELRRGVCQDFAHVEIAALRSLGLAARYVSGYLRTYPPAGQPRLVGSDASHAWLSVYCGPLGWVDIDPTNNLFPDTEHVTVAWGRDYDDVPPLRGVYIGGGRHSLTVGVDVIPIADEPAPEIA